MADYTIHFTRSARKELEALDGRVVRRVFPEIEYYRERKSRSLWLHEQLHLAGAPQDQRLPAGRSMKQRLWMVPCGNTSSAARLVESTIGEFGASHTQWLRGLASGLPSNKSVMRQFAA